MLISNTHLVLVLPIIQLPPGSVADQEMEPTPPRSAFLWQLLVYNHALVALWHEDAVVAVADIDEYLMTPEKTTLSKVMGRPRAPSPGRCSAR